MHRKVPSREAGWIDRAIAGLAAAQHGVVARRQLLALGIGEGAIQTRLLAGRLQRIHQGVYLVGHPVPPPRAAEMAAQLACEPHALISHRSAARLWELIAEQALGLIDVTVVGRDPNAQPGVRMHRTAGIERRDATRQGRLWLTSPARTLLDLASVSSPTVLENAVAQARRRGLVTEGDLIDQLVRNRGRRGAGRLRRLLDLEAGPSLTRSPPERRLLELIRASSLPEPETNQTVCGHEVDLLWRDERVVVEFDSREFHSDPLAFERDRLRDAKLAANGYVVIRVTWRQLQHPATLLARLRRTLSTRRDGTSR